MKNIYIQKQNIHRKIKKIMKRTLYITTDAYRNI